VPDNYTGRTFFAAAGWTVGVYSGSAPKEAARLFVAFLPGKPFLLSEKARAVPGAYSSPPPVKDPLYLKAWDIAIAAEASLDFIDFEGEHEVEEIFRQELAALFEGKSSAADAAQAIQKGYTKKRN
jgi:ABC-type glycerol-3-phosphate transport system substrate-binding protein